MIHNDILINTLDFYRGQYDKTNNLAKRYAIGRKLSNRAQEFFRFGFSPDRHTLVDYLGDRGYSVEEMLRYGVCKQKNGEIYDSMWGRLTIPINDFRGNLVGFMGRRLDDKNPIKYVNTPNTELFVKRFTLFNLDNAKYYIKYSNVYPCIILVEGQMDVIRLAESGVRNVVCSSGTAFTKEQAKLLRLFTDNVIILYDGDDAGHLATEKANKVLSDNHLNPLAINCMGNKDPDEYVLKYGVSQLKSVLNENIKKY